MANDYLWKRQTDAGVEIGLTDKAFEVLGQIWALIPTNERKRNYVAGDAILAMEGSDSLCNLVIDFPMKRINFNGDALERPDELTTNDVLLVAELA
jgi:glycine cleavage system H lipoate-binding protein